MIYAIGLDLVEIDRIRRLHDRHGPRMINRLLGDGKQELAAQYRQPELFIAGRFAAKEAIVKGLGKWLENRPAWHEMQILADASGQPYVQFADRIRLALPTVKCLVSISHERTHAAAVAIFTDDIS